MGIESDALSNHPPVPIILGPTAVGKTEISIILAERIDAEIISGDAFQVYRGMDIATAKPTPSQRERADHHLIDILDPADEYTAAIFRALALEKIAAVRSRGRRPLIVGGSGLYLRALVDGLFPAASVDRDYRRRLRREEEEEGRGHLHRILSIRDPAAARRIHPHNLKRIIRALEVLKVTGRPISSLQTQWREFQSGSGNAKNAGEGSEFIMIGLNRARKELYRRINQRTENMFANGLIEETKALRAAEIDPSRPSWKALGYREAAAFLEGEYPFEEAVRRLARNTRRYAKRQLTWWRKDERIIWIEPDKNESPEKTAERIKVILEEKS